MQAKPSTEKKSCQLLGGYQCIFVRDPPDHLQTECSICLCVLREPYLVDCCGYSFCKSCIEPIKADGKPCPLCAVKFTNSMPDKRLQRTLNDLLVYCSHREGGCEWEGQLNSLPQHLNILPSANGDRLSGCQLTSIECMHCGVSCQRQSITEHETTKCVQRPYCCEYCNDITGTYETVSLNHWPVCTFRPVACPNNCGESPNSKQLESHLKACPLEVIDCPFSYAGCMERLPRKDMPEHITQVLASHMSLQAMSHQQKLKHLHDQISELEEMHAQSLHTTNVRVDNNQLELKKLNSRIDALEELYKQSRAEVADLQRQNEFLFRKLQLECKNQVVPFDFTMPDFERNKNDKATFFSPPFYSHCCGYRMCLRVDANGWGDGKNSHVSIYLYMMKGEYDECLRWPFRGEVTIQLVNQMKNEEHLTKILPIDDRTPDKIAGRVMIEERCEDGRGFPKFIPHIDLQPNYLKNDSLKLSVKLVKVSFR